eukprot:Seg226.2 transcript_id=Seg226.2/GoldUCD/mRNA.D3Y31 product="39S ribosomal protein L22 mitochondrial" pseudo=true protein_id=Seg226.2/GoldUCD/D3Y31
MLAFEVLTCGQRLPSKIFHSLVSRRCMSQISITRAMLGMSEAESKKIEEIPNPPQLKIYHCKRDVRGMPRKMNIVAHQIRKLPVDEAITQMRFSPKKAAETILQTLEEAQKIAVEKYGVEDKSNLWVEQSYVGRGRHIKQIKYHAKGRFGNMKIYFCNYFLVLQEGPALGKNKRKRRSHLNELALLERSPEHIMNSLSWY